MFVVAACTVLLALLRPHQLLQRSMGDMTARIDLQFCSGSEASTKARLITSGEKALNFHWPDLAAKHPCAITPVIFWIPQLLHLSPLQKHLLPCGCLLHQTHASWQLFVMHFGWPELFSSLTDYLTALIECANRCKGGKDLVWLGELEILSGIRCVPCKACCKCHESLTCVQSQQHASPKRAQSPCKKASLNNCLHPDAARDDCSHGQREAVAIGELLRRLRETYSRMVWLAARQHCARRMEDVSVTESPLRLGLQPAAPQPVCSWPHCSPLPPPLKALQNPETL